MNRYLQIPRRVSDARPLVEPMTAWLRTPHGTMRLNDFQAVFLAEMLTCNGGYGGGRVGVGKTLASALAPVVLGATRPLLIVPGKHVSSGKTHREIAAYREHWRIPLNLRIESYERISTEPTLLDDYDPDVLILDECHKVKSVDRPGQVGSARARRVDRWIVAHPQARIVCLTGTPTRSSFCDYSHQLVWTLRRRAPVPLDRERQHEWALCIDPARKRRDYEYPDYRALSTALGVRIRDQDEAREAFQARLLTCPGVVISADRFEGTLTIRGHALETPDTMLPHWQQLRELMYMPDGWALADQTRGVWGAAQQLAQGFFYEPEPRPPEEFVKARRAWAKFCRTVLEHTETWDTEAQVRDACKAGTLPRDLWDAWHRQKMNFRGELKPRWLDYSMLDHVTKWGRDGGIVWTSHRAVGHMLAERTGWKFFSNRGMTRTGEPIDRATDHTIIASRQACGDGFNLQRYSRNLFVCPSKASLDWEQEMGRTHRDGQTQPVHVDYLIGCLENASALPCAMGYARYTESTLRQPQKLLQADLTQPSALPVGPAYEETCSAA